MPKINPAADLVGLFSDLNERLTVSFELLGRRMEGLAAAARDAAVAFESAFAGVCKTFRPWWPSTDDEWLHAACEALTVRRLDQAQPALCRLRRWRLAAYCVRRAWRSHCEALA
jgi:hypothetical protein